MRLGLGDGLVRLCQPCAGLPKQAVKPTPLGLYTMERAKEWEAEHKDHVFKLSMSSLARPCLKKQKGRAGALVQSPGSQLCAVWQGEWGQELSWSSCTVRWRA